MWFNELIIFGCQIYATVRSGSIAIAASTLDSLLDLMAGGILWFTHLTMKNVNIYKYPIGKLRMQPVGIIVFAAVMATLGIFFCDIVFLLYYRFWLAFNPLITDVAYWYNHSFCAVRFFFFVWCCINECDIPCLLLIWRDESPSSCVRTHQFLIVWSPLWVHISFYAARFFFLMLHKWMWHPSYSYVCAHVFDSVKTLCEWNNSEFFNFNSWFFRFPSSYSGCWTIDRKWPKAKNDINTVNLVIFNHVVCYSGKTCSLALLQNIWEWYCPCLC